MSEKKYLEEDEISLRELILKVKDFWKELLRNWWLIVLITIPFVLWFFYSASTTPVEYKSKLVFMINEDEGGSGGIAALAGQFGFNIGGGEGEYNKERIVSLAKSGKIVNPVIMDSLVVNGSKDIIGNHLIRLYEFHDKWAKSSNEELRTFYFTTDRIEELTRTGNSALKACYSLITGTKKIKALSSCGYNEDSGILSISAQSISDELSLGLTEKIFSNLKDFYVKQQVEPQLNSYKTIKAKADSLEILINSKEYELASLRDANTNVYLRKFKLREDRLKRELPVYATQYGALLQNVENADFLLKSKTPFFQVIDYPFFPLPIITESKIKSVVIGGFLGGFVAVLFLIGRKIIRDALQE